MLENLIFKVPPNKLVTDRYLTTHTERHEHGVSGRLELFTTCIL